MTSPRDIVNRQLDAYNARDLQTFCNLFADEAVLIDLPTGDVIAQGKQSIAELYAARFRDNPQLNCTVHSRVDLASFAIDRETVNGLPGGPVDIIAIYEVREGLIQSVRFIRQQRG
jgi:uncharacterized protein (TIGR02246 family)